MSIARLMGRSRHRRPGRNPYNWEFGSGICIWSSNCDALGGGSRPRGCRDDLAE